MWIDLDVIKPIAKAMDQLFLQDQLHLSFQRKKPRTLEHLVPSIYEFRIARQYRALSQVDGEVYGEVYCWIFIGNHASFDREIRYLSP
jgi:hypothetical protein